MKLYQWKSRDSGATLVLAAESDGDARERANAYVRGRFGTYHPALPARVVRDEFSETHLPASGPEWTYSEPWDGWGTGEFVLWVGELGDIFCDPSGEVAIG